MGRKSILGIPLSNRDFYECILIGGLGAILTYAAFWGICFAAAWVETLMGG